MSINPTVLQALTSAGLVFLGFILAETGAWFRESRTFQKRRAAALRVLREELTSNITRAEVLTSDAMKSQLLVGLDPSPLQLFLVSGVTDPRTDENLIFALHEHIYALTAIKNFTFFANLATLFKTESQLSTPSDLTFLIGKFRRTADIVADETLRLTAPSKTAAMLTRLGRRLRRRQ